MNTAIKILTVAALLCTNACAYATGGGFAAEEEEQAANAAAATAAADAPVPNIGNNYEDTAQSIQFNEKNGWATTYTVYIDPSFPSADQDGLSAALTTWTKAVPVNFNVSIAPCRQADAGQICIHNGNGWPVEGRPGGNAQGLAGWTVWSNDSADVYMYCSTAAPSSTPTSLFAAVAEHEIGHAQGLVHHNGFDIMNACVNCSNASMKIEADDANQWLSLRNLTTIPEGATLDLN